MMKHFYREVVVTHGEVEFAIVLNEIGLTEPIDFMVLLSLFVLMF